MTHTLSQRIDGAISALGMFGLLWSADRSVEAH